MRITVHLAKSATYLNVKVFLEENTDNVNVQPKVSVLAAAALIGDNENSHILVSLVFIGYIPTLNFLGYCLGGSI